jgi:hypothetical protein
MENVIDIFLNQYGNEISFKTKTVIDAKSNPIPWFTYPAIEYLNQLNLKDYSVFEWGAGNSSLYFGNNARIVNSVEHNKEWYDLIKHRVTGNNKIYLEIGDRYCNKPLEYSEKFDVIVIDGILREECINPAIRSHNQKGFIILDNSERYPDLSEIIRNSGYLQIDFHGFGPVNRYTWTTSFYFKSDLKLPIKTIQPCIPIGGGY